MLDRAFSLLEIKQVDEDARQITGMAKTPTADRMNDVVEPMGAQFTLPIPLLWQHRSDEPIGHVTHATVGKAGMLGSGEHPVIKGSDYRMTHISDHPR